MVNTIAATTANEIGDLSHGKDAVLNEFTSKAAHAIAGCALGAAHAGNSGGCAGGAIGAAMGEMMAEAMLSSPEMNGFYNDQDKVYLSGLVSGLSAALAGGDDSQIAAANWAGANAAANNALGHASKKLMEQARECAASPTDGCVVRVLENAKIEDHKFQARLEAACAGSAASFAQCNLQLSAAASALNDLELMRDLYGRDDPQAWAAYQGLVDQQRADMGRMQLVLDALRATGTPLETLVGDLAPNFSPADGAHIAGAAIGSAASALGSLNLNKSLASQQQLSQLLSGSAINISGNGTNVVLRDAPRLVAEYGGKASDWSKISSPSYVAADGSLIEVHAYRNAATGQVVEPKSIVLK